MVEDNHCATLNNQLGVERDETVFTRLATNKQSKYLTELQVGIEEVYNALPEEYKKSVRIHYWNKDKQMS